MNTQPKPTFDLETNLWLCFYTGGTWACCIMGFGEQAIALAILAQVTLTMAKAKKEATQ